MSCSYAGQTIGSTSGGDLAPSTSTIPIAQDGTRLGDRELRRGAPLAGTRSRRTSSPSAGQVKDNTASATWSEKLNFTIDNTYPMGSITGNQTSAPTRTG